MNEFKRIQDIQQILDVRAPAGGPADAASQRVLVGIGDDAAVLCPPQGSLVLSVDTAVEERHFRRAWTTLQKIGRRAAVAALSDLAAMGARPHSMLLSLLVPNTLTDSDLQALVTGVGTAAKEYDAPVVGGNLSAGGELSITTTVVGELLDRPMLRSGARVGHRLYCSGPVGAAALGLELCTRGDMLAPFAAPYLEHFLSPRAHIAEGRALRTCASACIDVSDGLLQDLGHLCQASGVGARIEYEALPLLPDFADACQALALSPMPLALGGGDDYVLLFSVSPQIEPPVASTPIGWVEEASVGIRVERNGKALDLSNLRPGFQHF